MAKHARVEPPPFTLESPVLLPTTRPRWAGRRWYVAIDTSDGDLAQYPLRAGYGVRAAPADGVRRFCHICRFSGNM